MNILPRGTPPVDPPEPARRERDRADQVPAEDLHEAEDEGAFRLSDVLGTLWAHKWLLAFTTLVCMGAAALYASTLTPRYTARAQVVIESARQQVVDFESVVPQLSNDWYAMNTELLTFRSERLMRQVAGALNLHEDPEFNPYLREPPEWKQTVGWTDLVAALGRAPEPRPEPTPEQAHATAAAILSNKVKVGRVPDTYAFEITVETQGAQKSADIANTVTGFYVENQRQAKFDAANDASVWLGERAVELKDELEAAEARVKDFAATARAVNEETVAANTQRLKNMRARQDELSERAAELRASATELDALRAAGDFRGLAERLERPELRQLATAIAAGEAGEDARARFDQSLNDRIARLRTEAEESAGRAASFDPAIAELAAEVQAQSSDLVTLRQYGREAEATRLIYEHFLARMKEVSVQEGIQRADARIIEPARAPGGPSYPSVRGIVGRGAVLGFVLGLALISLRAMLRNSLRTPEEAEAATGLAVLGVIPELRTKRGKTLISQLVTQPASAMAEAVRNLRTAVQLSNIDAPPQLIMLTSSVPEEGKSILSAALAQTSAMGGKRVLLVEGDLRRRRLNEYFEIESRDGLVSVLSGATAFDDAVWTDQTTGLDVLVAEDSKVTPVDLFDSTRFRIFLDETRKVYDLVVIDTPPVLAVPDARVIAQHADAVVYAVKWNATTRRMVQAGLDLLRQVNIRVTGLALTRIDPSRMDQYGYYGYGYGSGSDARKIQRYYRG